MTRRTSGPTAPGREEAQGPSGEHTTRTYSSREQTMFAVKVALIVGAVVLLLWFLDQTT